MSSGVAEMAEFPDALLHAFSTRHDQVAEEFTQMVASGFEPGAATEVAAQRATRASKTVLADQAVRAVQVAKLAEIGWTPEGGPGVGGRQIATPGRGDRRRRRGPAFAPGRSRRLDRTPDHLRRP